ncbi:hypothetical protein AJ80_09139 [Polytolypa hystricis UAMH7299]|uniref:NAD dependent epimerase/dehydratase n=1 Tax=Polytolypa hystricis (strain UAMH7299) TaxID=1447883 RepID=A0A2B7WVM4_POLH7|nr:hypothetical protein AJ80_09139 [Polytolypa hystricis UAMH7299]
MPTEGTSQERFPELFFQTEVDRRLSKRTVKMEVLVLGMMRTGTMSIRSALLELGIKGVYHMFEAVQNPPDAEFWTKVLNHKFLGKGPKWRQEELDGVLGDFQACLDMPTAALMPELIAAYPEAKVIIAMRDPDAWFTSVMRSVGKEHKKLNALSTFARQMLMWFDTFYFSRFFPLAQALEFGPFGPDGFNDPKRCKEIYVQMHEEVRRMVPKDRLLEFQLKEGWEPICQFLEKEIPSGPFPHINDSTEFDERTDLIARHAIIRGSKRLLTLFAIIVVGWVFVWKTFGGYFPTA